MFFRICLILSFLNFQTLAMATSSRLTQDERHNGGRRAKEGDEKRESNDMMGLDLPLFLGEESFSPQPKSYHCFSEEVSRGVFLSKNEKVVQFDYDIVLLAGTDVESEILSLEDKLLNNVGNQLMGSNCGLRRNLGKKGLRAPSRQRRIEVAHLDEISSLPLDEQLRDGTTCETRDSSYECYPISGYMTVYYYNLQSDDSSIKDQVELAINDSIEQGMTDGSYITDSVMEVRYVGVRGLAAENLLAEPKVANEQPSISGMAVIGIVVGAVAVLLASLLVLVRRRHKQKGNGSHPEDDSHSVTSSDTVEGDMLVLKRQQKSTPSTPTSPDAKVLNNIDMDLVHCHTNETNDIIDESSSQQSHLNWVSSVQSDEVTEIVSNVRYSNAPTGLAEQTISEEESEEEEE